MIYRSTYEIQYLLSAVRFRFYIILGWYCNKFVGIPELTPFPWSGSAGDAENDHSGVLGPVVVKG